MIKGALVSHIREGLNGLRQDSAKFLAYDKLETAQCTKSLDNNNTFTFTIEQLGLHKLVSMVAKDLYAVAKFINQLYRFNTKIDINELAHMLNALNVDYDVDLGGDGVHHKNSIYPPIYSRYFGYA
jgi:hypothetical protein